jgi:thiosulfate/3-mercaptopyruvate sulfurtransferase
MSKSRFALPLLSAALLLVAGCNEPDAPPVSVATSPMDLLVSVEWLHEHLDDPDLVVIDASVPVEPDGDGGFRTVSGRAAYEAGHIPTAGFADLKGELADQDSSLDFAVPSPEQFAAAMGALGVGDHTRVVIYDSYGSGWAARVWWMLRWVGFDNAAVLDGGLDAWKSAGYALSSEPASEPARTLTVNLRPQLIVERDEMRAAIDDEAVNIIDALPEAHFNGDFTMYARPGHIPTAENVPSMSLVDESGRFRSDDELNELFGTDRDKRTITYCGGGIAASADAFAMIRLGYKDVAVYTASLQEWAADPENPMVTGTARQ